MSFLTLKDVLTKSKQHGIRRFKSKDGITLLVAEPTSIDETKEIEFVVQGVGKGGVPEERPNTFFILLDATELDGRWDPKEIIKEDDIQNLLKAREFAEIFAHTIGDVICQCRGEVGCEKSVLTVVDVHGSALLPKIAKHKELMLILEKVRHINPDVGLGEEAFAEYVGFLEQVLYSPKAFGGEQGAYQFFANELLKNANNGAGEREKIKAGEHILDPKTAVYLSCVYACITGAGGGDVHYYFGRHLMKAYETILKNGVGLEFRPNSAMVAVHSASEFEIEEHDVTKASVAANREALLWFCDLFESYGSKFSAGVRGTHGKGYFGLQTDSARIFSFKGSLKSEDLQHKF